MQALYNQRNNIDKTIVVLMPLISLIKDNHQKSIDLNIKSLELHSEVDAEINESLNNYSLIYICPERLGLHEDAESDAFLEVLIDLYKKDKICRFVIDEAHTIKEWGQTFRKACYETYTLK